MIMMQFVPMTLVHSVVHVTLDLQEMVSYVIKSVVHYSVIQTVVVNHMERESLVSVMLGSREMDLLVLMITSVSEKEVVIIVMRMQHVETPLARLRVIVM